MNEQPDNVDAGQGFAAYLAGQVLKNPLLAQQAAGVVRSLLTAFGASWAATHYYSSGIDVLMGVLVAVASIGYGAYQKWRISHTHKAVVAVLTDQRDNNGMVASMLTDLLEVRPVAQPSTPPISRPAEPAQGAQPPAEGSAAASGPNTIPGGVADAVADAVRKGVLP